MTSTATTREPLFELVSQRSEQAAVLIITSNLPFDELTETVGSERGTVPKWRRGRTRTSMQVSSPHTARRRSPCVATGSVCQMPSQDT